MRTSLPRQLGWLLFLLCMVSQVANAQVTVQIGTGTDVPANTLYFPVYRFTAGSTTTGCRSNVLFTADELASAGLYTGVTITSLQFNKTNQAHFLIPANYKMYMGNTANTSLPTTTTWASILTTHTQVYSNASFDVQDAPGWFTINVTPFVYTGGSLEIASELAMTGGSTGATDMFKWEYTDAVPADRIVGVSSATGATLNGTVAAYKHRPNIKISFTEPAGCTSPPDAGTATTSNANVCNGEPFDLNLSGNTTGSGQTYQWQSSPDNTNWTNINGATSVGTTQTQSATTYYHCIVTCSGVPDTSTAVLVTSPALVHGVFTINNGAATGGTNFASFTDAINSIKCGIDGPVVFNVDPASAPYNEQIKIPAIFGTSATNTITINGNGATFSFNATASADRVGIYLDGTDHLTIDSLVIDGSAGGYGWGVFLTNAADSNTIKRCTINVSSSINTSAYHIPIVISGSPTSSATSGNNGNYNTFMNNTLTGGYYGVAMYGQSGTYNQGNRSIGNSIADFYTYGHYVYGQEDAVVSGNDITRPTRASSGTLSGAYLSTSNGALIEKNRIHNLNGADAANTSTCYPIYITTADGSFDKPNRIINNLVYDIAGNGTLYGLYNSGSDSTLYYHNTVVLDYASATTAACYGIYQTTAATGVDFRNNIIYITRGGTGIKRGIHLNTTTSEVVSNNNVYYLAPPAGTDNKLGQYGTTSYETLTEWKNANSGAYDQASFFVDPLFQNITPDEFKPSEASINNIGVNLGVATDIYGVARTPLPDPGAVEFVLGGCSNPPTAGIATTTDATPCSEATFTLNLDGNSSGAGQTYQWQWSTDHINWSNVGSPQTTPLLSTSQTESHYYRAEVRCSGGAPVYSDSVFVERPVIAGNYTINNLLPTGAGNFASFGEAVAFLKCGVSAPVVFTVEPFTGPYNEKVIIGEIGGASAVNTITFMGNGATLSYAPTGTSDRVGLVLNGADHIIIDSLTVDVTGGATYGWGIALTGQADSNIIRKCNIITSTSSTTSGNTMGIVMNGSLTGTASTGNHGNYNLFEGNSITGGYHGFYIYGSSSAFNKGNMFVNNKVLDQYAYAMYIYGQKQATISKNDISRPARTSSTTIYGVYVISCGDSLLIEKNRVHNMFDAVASPTSSSYGIYISSGDGVPGYPSRIENNLVHSINNNGLLYGIYCAAANWNIYHNTVILDNTASTSTSTTYAFYGNDVGINIKNNIGTISRGGTGTKVCVYLGTTFSGEINFNDWLMTASSGTNYIGYKSSGYTTLDDWKASNGNAYDQNSLSVDPLFQQLAPGDFYPSEASLNNRGENVGVLTDIVDSLRTITPDPGAFEFSVAGCVNPPSAGTIVTVSSVCPNANFVLDLSGNTVGEGITYQWQVSSNNVDWVNIGGPSALSSLSTTQAAGSYYQVLVKCNAGTPVPTPSVFVSSPGLAPAGTYSINNAQPTGSGNFQSFGDAVNFIACGIAGPIVFNVTPNSGPYNEQVIVPAINGTSTTNTITWNGNGAMLSYSVDDAGKRGVLILDGSDHMIFDSLNIDASLGTYGYGIILTNRADSNIIRKCNLLSNTTSTSTNYGGIIMSGSTAAPATQGYSGSGNLFTDNILTGGYYGIYIYGSTADTIQYNKAIGNTIKDFYYYGLYTIYSRHTTFSGNDLSRPTRTNAGGAGDIVLVGTSYGGMLVEKNRIHNIMDAVSASTAFYGFNIGGGDGTAELPNRLENNMVYNIRNPSGTAICYPVYGLGADYWKVAHNTINIDDATAAGGNTYGMYLYASNGTTVYNNIISITRGGTGTKYCLYTSTTGLPASNNNVLYMNSPAGTNAIGYYSSARTTLADWQAAGFDANSVSTDPLFMDVMSGNLAPQESSIFALGNGLTGVTTDILEVARRANNPTPGAYEMQVGLPVTMLSLDAIRVGEDVKVNWATLTEQNNKGFQVERSLDGTQFRHIGFVSSKANNGNSTAKLVYEFLDMAAPTSDIYYRLKQVDNNGKEKASNIVRIKAIGNKRFDITSLYPNPVRSRGDLTLMMTSQDISKLTLVITDVTGKILKQQPAQLVQGTNTMKVNVSNLPAGNYFIRAICADGCETSVKKFVIQ